MSACGCCTAPPCPTPLLECDSVSNSESKRALCGTGLLHYRTHQFCDGNGVLRTNTYSVDEDGECHMDSSTSEGVDGCCTGDLFFDDGKYYRRKITTTSNVGENVVEASNGDKTTITVNCVIVVNEIRRCNEDPEIYYGVGDGTLEGTIPNTTSSVHLIEYSNGNWYKVECEAIQDIFTGVWTGTSTVSYLINGMQGEESTPTTSPCCNSGTPFDWCSLEGIVCSTNTEYEAQVLPFTESFSNPDPGESTESLISKTIESLPDFPGTWDGSCASIRNLSEDENSYSIRRIKWRVAHPPTGTCYLKVWLQKRFTPEDEEAEEVITPLTAYEWNGTGNPCLTDPAEIFTDEANRIEGSATTEDEPATNGETTIEIVKWSCVEGYEPPDDGSANGYPVPGDE